jgi:endonuclease YncB( thermonuclease family)
VVEITQETEEGWVYEDCELVRVIDGDTLVLTLRRKFQIQVDFGFRIKDVVTLEKEGTFHFRLADVNTPEIRGKSKVQGYESKEAVERLLVGASIKVVSLGEGKYGGRWIGKIYVTPQGGEELYLSEWLIEEKLGKPYRAR